MAVLDGDFAALTGQASRQAERDEGRDQIIWTEEPAHLTDYIIFLGALVVSFGVLGAGFWALFSYLFPAI